MGLYTTRATLYTFYGKKNTLKICFMTVSPSSPLQWCRPMVSTVIQASQAESGVGVHIISVTSSLVLSVGGDFVRRCG